MRIRIHTQQPPHRLATATLSGGALGLGSSSLGLGCAELFSEPSAKARRRILDVAFDCGICHFDVAPMYGLGIAEGELGRFARGRRDQIVIATKCGIMPTAPARALACVQAPIRRLMARSPQLRAQARESAPGPSSGSAGRLLYRNIGFDGASAHRSLDASLRRIGTEYVDLLLLHDPDLAAVHDEDLCSFLEDARRSGRIRAWGVAGEVVPTLSVARGLSGPPSVLQVRGDILDPLPEGLEAMCSNGIITFGWLGASVNAITDHVGQTHERRHRWREEVGGDCAHRSVVARLVLRAAQIATRSGVVLFGTTQTEHVIAASSTMSEAPALDLNVQAFLDRVNTDLRSSSIAPPGQHRDP